MIKFKEFLQRENEEYCQGLSLNVDFYWNNDKNVEFLTMRGKDLLLNQVMNAVHAGNMNVVDKRLTSYGPNPDFGFTYLVVLGQSHIVLHTWPEKFFMNIDVFTCGSEGDPKAIIEFLKRSLTPDHMQMNQAQRGVRKDVKDVNEKPDAPQDINKVPANS